MKIKILGLLTIALATASFLLKDDSNLLEKEEIKLIVRGDDIGSFHAANIACIRSYSEGIMRSVEIMVPCAWYPEAVTMLNENPGLDVGVHLVMTSEWETMKWRPLTGISSITDESGFFYPMVWPNDHFPPHKTFRESGWTIEDVERELREQIELAIRDIPAVSHISSHMGFQSASQKIDSLINALAVEYNLSINPADYGVKRFVYDKPEGGGSKERIDAFIDALRNLEPGTYLFVEHPALDTPEMETIGHIGYGGVGEDRQMVTEMFTSKKIVKEIGKLNIKLISYADLKGK